MTTNPLLHLHDEVADALRDARPVVALESTVLTHGLPAPTNVETGLELERIVRDAGAVPATIALLGGRVHVGLTADEVEALTRPGAVVDKVSLWNLPAVVARGANGGTTVAATAHLARLAGIDVFSTGGIGGVHTDPFDESADLPALARTPIVVVSAGAKSILNLGATLERLETLGVPLIGYRTDRLPAFHSVDSPWDVPARLDSPRDIARAHLAARLLGMHHAILIANPVPTGLPYDTVQSWVDAAAHEARKAGVHGKALTPFLLARLAQLSGGESVRVNLDLLRANVRLGAEIAAAIHEERGWGPA